MVGSISTQSFYLLYNQWSYTTAFQVFQRDWDTMHFHQLKNQMNKGKHSGDKDANYDYDLQSYMEQFENTWDNYNSNHELLSIYINNYSLIQDTPTEKDFFYYLTCHNPKSILPKIKKKTILKWLSDNHNLRLRDVIQFSHKKWDWKRVFQHSILDILSFIQYPHIPWDFQALSNNRSITKEIVLHYPNQNWNWKELSRHIEWDIVLQLPDKPWDYKEISRGKRQYWRDLASLQGEIERCIQCNITWDIVSKHPQIPWNYSVLSDNPNITMQHIFENINQPWNYSGIMRNINFEPKYMRMLEYKMGISIDWNLLKGLIFHSNTTLQDWEQYLDSDTERDYKCYFILLSYNPNLTWDFFINNDYRWDYDFILTNGLFREKMTFIMDKIEQRSKFLQELKEKVREYK